MKFSDMKREMQDEILRDLYRTGRSVLEKWNLDESIKDDILQASILWTVEKFDSLRQPDKMHAWVRSIIINEAKHYLKTRREEEKRMASADSLFCENSVSSAEEMLYCSERETALKLYSLILELGEPTGTILLRAALCDESFSEIGKQLGMKPVTVRSHARRARVRLKQRILEDEELAERCRWYLRNGK